MKEVFVQYAAHNIWANGLLLQAIQSLGEEAPHQQVVGSFPSLYKTLLHLWDAESVWWQRIKLQEQIIWPGETFTGGMEELAVQLLKQNRQWQEWVNSLNEHGLQHEFIYLNSKKERFKQPVYQMLLHLFNHNTYHRGQLVTMLRQLGVEKIPATDFILWSRKK